MYIRPSFVVVIVGAVLTSLSTIIVALRYYCRYVLAGTLGAADHLMLTALFVTWGNVVVNYYMDETSRHTRPRLYKIPEKRPLMEGYVRGVLVTWWWYRIGYVIALCFIKLSILSFYRTITTNRVLRHLVAGTAAFVVAYTFGATLAAIFQCKTPSDAWSTAAFFAQFDKVPDPNAPHVQCYDATLFFLATAGLNLFSDIVILLLPIPMLLGLRVPRKQRIAVVGIFSIGLMAIVASAVRVHVMRLWAISPINSTRYGNSLLLWGQVEANSGIISASVPFLRLLFRSGDEGTNRGLRRVREIQPPKLSKSEGSHELELDEITLVHGERDLEAGNGAKGHDEKASLQVTTAKKDMGGDDLDNMKPTSPRMLA